MPLWQPNPLHPSPDYCAKGLTYGDVGYITNDRVFEFRFNALLPRSHPFQAYGVPDGFSPFENFLPAEIGGEFKDVVMEEDQWHDTMACIASEHAETKKIQIDAGVEIDGVCVLCRKLASVSLRLLIAGHSRRA